MDHRRIGQRSIRLAQSPGILSHGSAAGQKEGAGPLGGQIDRIVEDPLFGQKSWEQAESRFQQLALELALSEAGLETGQLEAVFGGDLLNQCIASNYALRGTGVPFFGLYGACSTMGEGLLLAALAVDGGYARRAAAITSSHFAAAERQYRFPLEYGGQRTPTAQWTVTGAGCAILSRVGGDVCVTSATPGRLVDKGITDANNMGCAMAPAAYDTIQAHLDDLGRAPEAYDRIVTGDLGAVGMQVVRDFFQSRGVSLGSRYQDCGVLIYDRKNQDVHAGGSGCGCSAVVLGHLLGLLRRGEAQRILFCPTGALHSPVANQQGESIPAICHAICLERRN